MRTREHRFPPRLAAGARSLRSHGRADPQADWLTRSLRAIALPRHRLRPRLEPETSNPLREARPPRSPLSAMAERFARVKPRPGATTQTTLPKRARFSILQTTVAGRSECR